MAVSQEPEPPHVEVYQIYVWIKEISPSIWRRLLVRSDCTIYDLHYALQLAFGWSDSHLHQFTIYGKPYGIYKDGGVSFSNNPKQVRLADLHWRINERFLYQYELGANWEHEIRFEKRLELVSTKEHSIRNVQQEPGRFHLNIAVAPGTTANFVSISPSII